MAGLSQQQEVDDALVSYTWLTLAIDSERNIEKRQQLLRERDEMRRIIIDGNIKYVVSIARKFQFHTPGFELSDLIQEGCLGIAKALETYDVFSNNRFLTYAHMRIFYTIQTYVAANKSTVRVTLSGQKQLMELTREAAVASHKEGRLLTEKEMMERREWRDSRISRFNSRVVNCLSTGSTDVTPVGYIEEGIDETTSEERSDAIEALLEDLDSETREAIDAVYGLTPGASKPTPAQRKLANKGIAEIRKLVKTLHLDPEVFLSTRTTRLLQCPVTDN